MFYYFYVNKGVDVFDISEGNWDSVSNYIFSLGEHGVNVNYTKEEGIYMVQCHVYTEFLSDSKEELERFRKKLLIENL